MEQSIAGPQRGRKGWMRSEESEKAGIVSLIKRKISVTAVKAQAFSLLGRLEGLGSGAASAAGRRREALELARRWDREKQAHRVSLKQGFNVLRRGFAMQD